LVGSRGMIAAIDPRSSGPKPHETPLSGLNQGSLQPLARHVEVGGRLPVDPHAALGDQTARLTGRGDTQVFHEQGRKMDRIPVRKGGLRDLLRRLMLAHDAGVVFLAGTGTVHSVPTRDDASRELELPLHRVYGMRALVDA